MHQEVEDMELLIIAVVWAVIALAAVMRGTDSRRWQEHEPYRSI